MALLLEAPVFTLEAALKAAEVGVHRLELCADFGEGGVTPSVGMLAYLKSKIRIPIFAMIRPRGGDFVYSEEEVDVMLQDIRILKNFGADGFVFGVLNKDGSIDDEKCKLLRNAAADLPCTFHRAFDISRDQFESMEILISLGFDRILTSGGYNNVSEGMDNLLSLLKKAKNRVTIMPGGGTKPEHVRTLANSGYLTEVHASCKTVRLSKSEYEHDKVSLSQNAEAFKQVLTIDEAMVKRFLNEFEKENDRARKTFKR